MAYLVTIGATCVLLLLGWVGYRRDIRGGILALIGTLLGAALVDFWGDRWAAQLVEWTTGDVRSVALSVRVALLTCTSLLAGYGSSTIFSNHAHILLRQRIVGGLFGVLNGIILIGYVLRYAAAASPEFAALITRVPIARVITGQLPYLLLIIACLLASAGALRAIMRLIERREAVQLAPPATPPLAGQPMAKRVPSEDRWR